MELDLVGWLTLAFTIGAYIARNEYTHRDQCKDIKKIKVKLGLVD